MYIKKDKSINNIFDTENPDPAKIDIGINENNNKK
tara:strand:- start:543 stop:647 length:105 start_codon:yes stop_codon:yes gene_type:complete